MTQGRSLAQAPGLGVGIANRRTSLAGKRGGPEPAAYVGPCRLS